MGKITVKPIQSILIANRGEIAVRVIKTARKMGIRSVAVYSQADKDAPHVRLADEAMLIGPAPAAQSYLSITKVINAAKNSGVQAIHPGYGFLSENDVFAQACHEAGIIFIGPQVDAIQVMGNKATAKSAMETSNVPVIPGYQGDDQSLDAFCEAANQIGFPIMVKAAFGGGGRGMRIVDDLASLASAIEQAREEAISGFGDGRLILEKSISGGRHIEFQIFGDQHGNLVHLGERDCSMQRRHQKVIEETPSPALNDQLREKMATVAITAAKSVSYIGAGTVEFLLDDDEQFYFLEMNTRLQVEHTVSEMVTGIDLVEWQIRVAAGERLGFRQNEINFTGHAIEARYYAEDPDHAFAPSLGRIEYWHQPSSGGVRVDSGIDQGLVIGPYYDAMVAKVITHCDTRQSAIDKLSNALKSTVLIGPKHNKNFLLDLLSSKEFSNGETTTEFIDRHFVRPKNPEAELKIACHVAALEFIDQRQQAYNKSNLATNALMNWSSCVLEQKRFVYRGGNGDYQVSIDAHCDGKIIASCTQLEAPVLFNEAKLEADGFWRIGEICHSEINGRSYQFIDISRWSDESEIENCGGNILATMHGVLAEISVNIGDKVEPLSVLGTVEAMKMRHDILAGTSGTVSAIHAKAGSQIATGDLIFELEVTGKGNATST